MAVRACGKGREEGIEVYVSKTFAVCVQSSQALIARRVPIFDEAFCVCGYEDVMMLRFVDLKKVRKL